MSKKSTLAVRPEATSQKKIFWITGILAITFIVFIPAIRNLFVTFDDPQYVIDNQYITNSSANHIKSILLEDANHLGNYHPLTLLSFVANYFFSELNPEAYHLTNVLIHLFNTYLVFQLALLLFVRLGSDNKLLLSSVTALLFGIHPLHVESVAWVSGRKDLLYTCFYLLALLSYIKYIDKKALKFYISALFCFILSLLSKGMAVSFSLVIIAIDYLFKRDLLKRQVILEKIPFLVLSVLFGLIAIMMQQAQGATTIIKYTFPERIVFASYGFTQYLLKLVFPYHLSGYYPYPDLQGGSIPGAYYLSLLPVFVTGILLPYFILKRNNRIIVFGGLFFILNILLVIQLFPVGSAVMADRYTYLSSFGLFFLSASGLGFLIRKFKSYKVLILSIVTAYAAILSVISNQRCTVWHDRYSFWTDVMVKYPNFYPAINNLGVFNEEEGKTQEAIQLFSNSIKVNEHNPDAYFHRGSIYGKSGQYREAISDLDQAVRYSPGFSKAYINRGIAKAMMNDYRGALADLDHVLAKEKNEEAYLNRGVLKNNLKEYSLAIPDFQEAINLNPSCTKCYYSLGLANYYTQKFSEAIRAFSNCIDLNPSYNYAYYYRALSYIGSGKADSSCSDLQKSVDLGIKEAKPLLEQYCRK